MPTTWQPPHQPMYFVFETVIHTSIHSSPSVICLIVAPALRVHQGVAKDVHVHAQLRSLIVIKQTTENGLLA